MFAKQSALIASTSCIGCIVNALPATVANSIIWYQCDQNSTIPYTCGNLTVPLDYSESNSNQTFTLSLTKVNATTQPSMGSIIFNPGGPGETGTDFVTDLAGPLLIGTGATLPVSCYENDADRLLAYLRTPVTTNTSDTALGTMWAVKQSLAQVCYENAHEIGDLVGTAFVARDMMQIVDALREDGMLRFWGFSYGTLLGATVAAMFPDRMDKVVLDGVLNPTQYYEGRDIQELATSDASFAGFFNGCLAAPPGSCALARPNVTASQLEQDILDLLYDLKYNPIAAAPAEATTIVDYGALKSAITLSLYGPSYWPGLAVAFDGLLQGNASALVAFVGSVRSSTSLNLIEVNAAIRCGDNSLRGKYLKDVLPVVDALYNESFILGDIEAQVTLTCGTWLMQAKERYEGGFNEIHTKNPILFVGNTYDPLTPLVSAQNASAGFSGSVVLQHDGYGHSSLAQPSLCTAKTIRAYFVNSTLPAPGTICEPDVPLFSNVTMLEVLAPIANLTKRGLNTEDDVALLTAMKRLSGRVDMSRVF
ncbi:uncharacterized protein LY89DRAFT_787846 [Mollisia scopiformis]|uniref:Uncharacterized protein n=1 Tax=Mollisia scopiformis TaxID=149040 RepID=A0A132BC07_MOLSC|nr:uncharacterized protein LY89DRAFT_787846 [Mollisia scopiformis]KUJ09539.1 hypothetical protein LY89DRAFT_787846 [Mollisia scopiformis]